MSDRLSLPILLFILSHDDADSTLPSQRVTLAIQLVPEGMMIENEPPASKVTRKQIFFLNQ
jgi:hypothetical protein